MKAAVRKILCTVILVLAMMFTLSLTTMAAGTVARIGAKGYASLDAALQAVKDHQTIKVMKNLTLPASNSVIASSNADKFTLDLNGKTLKSKSSDPIVLKGNITLKNGTIKAGVEVSGKTAHVTLSNCNITGSKYELYVTKGNLTIRSGNYRTVVVRSNGKLTIRGGSVCNASDLFAGGEAIFIQNGTVTITGGKIEGGLDPGRSAICCVDGTVLIRGGTVLSKKDSAIYMNSGTLKITGGKVQCTVADVAAIDLVKSNVETSVKRSCIKAASGMRFAYW